jgi:hypothetical protein
MIKFIKSLFCYHNYEFKTNIYGDGIFQWNGRSLHCCSKCNKLKVEQFLKKETECGDDSDEEFFKEHDRVKSDWKEQCPEFDFREYQKVIDWLNVDSKMELVWENEFISYKNGVKTVRIDERLAHWTFCWKFGFIGFCSFKKDEEERAKIASAIFVWLWLKKGVPAEYASDFAESYARRVVIRG